MAQERKDIITDEALMAPLVMAENLEVEYEWLLKVSKAGRETGKAVDQSESTKKLRDEITKLAGEQQKLLKTQSEVAASTQKSIQVDKTALASLNANRIAYSSLRTEEERTSKVGKDLLKTIQDQSKALGENGKVTQNYAGATGSLRKELKLARDEMVVIAQTLGEDSAEFQEAALRAGELQDKLGDIADASKVVSGDTAFEKMGAQVGLLSGKLRTLDFKGATAQLKGLTTTVQGLTFKESINGLGGFVKGIGGLGKVLLTNPIFLLATVLIGITLAVNALKDKLFPLIAIFDAVGAGIDWIVQKAKDFSDAMGLSAFAAEDNAKRVTKAVEEQQKRLNQKYNDEIRLAEAAGESVVTLELSKQRAIQGTSEKAIAAMDAQIKAGSKLSEDQKKQYDEFKQMAHDAEIEQKVLMLQRVADIKKTQEEITKEIERQTIEREKLEQFRVSKAIKIQEDIKNVEGKSLEQRIAASVKAEQLKEKLIRMERDAALRKLDGDVFTEKLIKEKAAADILAVQKAATSEQRKLLIESIDEQAELLEGVADNEKNDWQERISAADEALSKRVDSLDLALQAELISLQEYQAEIIALEQATTDKIVDITLERQQKVADALADKAGTGVNDELIALEESLGAQEITYDEYTKRRAEIQKNANDNSLQLQLDFLKEQAELLKQAGVDTTSIQKDISDAELEIAREKNELLIEAEEEKQELLKELQTEGVEGILSIIDNFNAAADEKRAAESEKIAEKLASDLELVGTNEDAKAELRNKAEVEQAKLRKEQAAADRKRAIFEKATAALSIGVNTAKGIGMALGTYPPPVSFVLAALVGVLGAIQLGVVLSKPIPTYAKGTKNHPGGIAIVGEEGSELITSGGKEFLSPSTATAMELDPHATVLPHEETMSELARRAVGRVDSTRGTREDAQNTRRLEKKLDQIDYTIRNKKELHVNFTKRGAEAVFAKAESRERMLNELYY